MQAVLDYCMEGNIDAASPQKSFADIATNPARTWYHVPWLHLGREFIHGLTMERGSPPKILGPLQTHRHTNWAVGFYNPLGGYAIGQVWKNETAPDPTKANFPEGTVSCKLLFSSAPLTEVPFLNGSLAWQANIVPQADLKARPTVRLLQLDIAVKDSRAPVTGWVFGTFQYEKAASSSPQWWKHMVPVGLMWGNDLANIKAHQDATTQWINTTRGQQFHLGFRGLLNGPIDNPQASCVACHGFAQVAKPGVANPMPKLPANNTWSANMSNADIDMFFQPIAAATALSASYQSVDYSLQLQIGISTFRAHHAGPASADGVPQIMSR
jgi:mono/diheme cytochrome c family protein